jgi:ABC-type lipoprotein export system ATPase subunit
VAVGGAAAPDVAGLAGATSRDVEGIATDKPVIELRDVIRVYREADVETIALRGVDLAIQPGEFVAIMGRSGSGKSTLLQLLAGSDRPTAGRVIVAGVDLSRADDDQRASLRGARVGIAFQSQNLVPFLDLVENVQLAATLAGRPVDRSSARVMLERVGLEGRTDHRPAQLSGGEQQRAAIALVLAGRPSIILADEITGELDSTSAALLLDLLEEIHRSEGVTMVVATHDPDVARRADRTVTLRDGRIVDDRRR